MIIIRKYVLYLWDKFCFNNFYFFGNVIIVLINQKIKSYIFTISSYENND